MQTAFHILSLVKELNNTIVGGTILSTEFYKKERSAYIFIKKDKSTNALGFVFHPAGFGTYLVPASKIRVDTREKPWPIFDIVGATITEIKQLGFDRIFQITIENDNKKRQLVFESIGPNGNIWLTDENNIIQATLRKREYSQGEIYRQPKLPDAISPLNVSAGKLQQGAKDQNFYSIRQFLQKQLFGVNKTIASELVKRSGLEDEDFSSLTESHFQELSKSIGELIELFEGASSGYLYQIAGAIEVYPFKLSSQESQPE
ncbi:MAG: NFACT family protein, partial [candidate division Zixibacteria bacterium]|nr:NFACT family protein [candidate division Zixibacteria bacterium]